MSRILVTGGTGFIGGALSLALRRAGHRVRVFDNGSRGAVRRFGDAAGDFDIVQGDIRDAAAVRAATAGVDSVFHLAYVNGTEFFYQKPGLILDVGVRGMLNVIDACAAEGVGDLVLLSSSEVYQSAARVPTDETAPLVVPDPFNPRYSYGGGKIISELLAIHLASASARVRIVRPHNVFGPDMGWEHVVPQLILRIARLAARDATRPLPLPIRGSGAQTRAFVHVDDFVRGLLLVWDKGDPLGLYHVGSMEELRIADVAAAIAAEIGVAVTLVPSAPPVGETERRCPDTRKLQALGFGPVRPFREAVREVVRWYLDHRALWPPEPSREGAT